MPAKTNLPDLAITYRPLDALKLPKRQLRLHSKRDINQLARLIDQLGVIMPLAIAADGEIIIGAARFAAAAQLGIERVPTVELAHLTREQQEVLRIADNKLVENGTWDTEALGLSLKELSVANLQFDLELTGFHQAEIDRLILSLDGDPDPVPEPDVPAGPAVTKPGDIWILGDHRIACGSALDPEVYGALMGGKRAAIMVTDPPYNVPIAGNVGGLGKIHHREFAQASGEMSPEEFTRFLSGMMALAVQHSQRGALHYVFMDWRHLTEMSAAIAANYGTPQNLCVWVKNNGGMGSLYRSRHELIFVCRCPGGRHRNNVQLGKFGRNRSNVWEYDGATTFSRRGDEGNLLALHPTVKPVQMLVDALLDASVRGDLVLDPFLGSGSTLIAAERTGRACRGIELDPLYVDTAVRRWQAHTGGKAVHATTGASFDKPAGAEGQPHG